MTTEKTESKKKWTPPDECPECGNPGIIPVYERHSIACPECRKEIPIK